MKSQPFGRWMEIAGGILGWSETQFWDSSYQYFQASIDGWMEKNGVKSDAVDEDEYEQFKTDHVAELSLTSDDLARIRGEGAA